MRILLTKKSFALISAAMFLFPAFSDAGFYRSPVHHFSIELPENWAPRPPEYEGVAAAFANTQSGEFANIAVRELETPKTVDELTWEELFSPQSQYIDIKTQGMTLIGGVRAKFCLYAIKDSPFKRQLEGKLNLMYLNYVVIWKQQLYSVTFTDAEELFLSHYSSFIRMITTMKFYN